MAVNFGLQVYNPTFNVFARPVIFTPTASQPGQPDYSGRGIYNSGPIDVDSEGAVISDATTILDIIEQEFPIPPKMGDSIFIDATGDLPALGSFEIADVDNNGGGELTLTLRKTMVRG